MEIILSCDFGTPVVITKSDRIRYGKGITNLQNTSMIMTGLSGDLNQQLSVLRYQPPLNYHGIDSMTIHVREIGGGASTRTIWMNVLPVNDSPVITAPLNATTLLPTATVPRGQAATKLYLPPITVTDPDEDEVLKVTITCSSSGSSTTCSDRITTTFFQGGLHLHSSVSFSGPIHIVTQVLDGTHITYLPLPTFTGLETITVTIADSKNAEVVRTFTVMVAKDPVMLWSTKPELQNSLQNSLHTLEDVTLRNLHDSTTLQLENLPVQVSESDADVIVYVLNLYCDLGTVRIDKGLETQLNQINIQTSLLRRVNASSFEFGNSLYLTHVLEHIEYISPSNYHGIDSLYMSLTITKNGIVQNARTDVIHQEITIDIESVNDQPTITHVSSNATLSYVTLEDQKIYLNHLIFEDVDVADALNVSVWCDSTQGNVVLLGPSPGILMSEDLNTSKAYGTSARMTSALNTSRILFTPTLNYHGTATVHVTAMDQHQLYTRVLVPITVVPVNDPITISTQNILNGEVTVDEDTQLVFDNQISLNDPDTVSGSTIILVVRVQHGTVTMDLSMDSVEVVGTSPPETETVTKATRRGGKEMTLRG